MSQKLKLPLRILGLFLMMALITSSKGCFTCPKQEECTLPSPLPVTVTDSTSTTISLDWNDVPGAASYKISYEPTGAPGAPTDTTTTLSNITLSGLLPDTEYEISIVSNCTDSTSSTSPPTIIYARTGSIIITEDVIDGPPPPSGLLSGCCDPCTVQVVPLSSGGYDFVEHKYYRIEIKKLGALKSRALLYRIGNNIYNFRDTTCKKTTACPNGHLKPPIRDSSGNFLFPPLSGDPSCVITCISNSFFTVQLPNSGYSVDVKRCQ